MEVGAGKVPGWGTNPTNCAPPKKGRLPLFSLVFPPARSRQEAEKKKMGHYEGQYWPSFPRIRGA